MRRRKEKSVFREYAESIIIAIVLALVMRQFVVQAFKIPSGSMEHTLEGGETMAYGGCPPILLADWLG